MTFRVPISIFKNYLNIMSSYNILATFQLYNNTLSFFTILDDIYAWGNLDIIIENENEANIVNEHIIVATFDINELKNKLNSFNGLKIPNVIISITNDKIEIKNVEQTSIIKEILHTQNSMTVITMQSDNTHSYIFNYIDYEVDYWGQVLLPYTSFINLIKNWFTDRKEISLTIFNNKVIFSIDNGKTDAKLEIHSVKYNTENVVPYVFKISGSSLNRLKTFSHKHNIINDV